MPRYARVIIDTAVEREFDYLIPDSMLDAVQVGSRVRVPFRNREALGAVVGLLDTAEVNDPKPITALLSSNPVLSPLLIELARWMAEYYCCPVETAMRSVLPQVIRKAEKGFRQQLFVDLLKQPTAEEMDQIRGKAARQAELLQILVEKNEPMRLSVIVREFGISEATVKALAAKGYLGMRLSEVRRDPFEKEEFIAASALPLTAEQELAMEAVKTALEKPGEHPPILLHGVTGSGKTEIYLQSIRMALDRGKTAIVLVPEISLTPQTVERFKSRFNDSQDSVAVLHSHLSEGERHDEWHKIHAGRASIVIGARSAVFAPVKDLGLIVVDEEHESSYKQEEAPRYHARDIAVVRAKMEKCPVILGSATPSLESYHNAQTGKYKLVRLSMRIDDRKMPLIRIVDMRLEAKKNSPIISERLRGAIENRLAKKEQTILFLNRRGFSTALLCMQCGFVSHCPNCSLALTYHRSAEKLVCHICGHIEVAPKKCPDCKDPGIRYSGVGTEKVEDAVVKMFPKATVRRMDADAMTRKDAYREALTAFRTGKIDILVGTQMIAKGLHFPNVTLVGIINADTALHLPDFRAGERTFQLLTQVAGRAGRGEMEGEVFVQTHTPFSPSIQFARHHDYEGFWDQESGFREKCEYPPYTHMVLITVRSPHQVKGSFSAETFGRRLREKLPEGVAMSEPAPAPIEKSKGYFRFHIMLRSRQIVKLSRYIKETLSKLQFPEEVAVAVDIDPYQLL